MRILLSILILIFTLQSWTKADDIRDFEIEGMSIGDSALDYFSKEVIDERKKNGFVYPNKEFFSATIYDDPKFGTYDHVQLHIKDNDDKYIIHSISGHLDYKKKDIAECYNQLEIINEQFKRDFDYIDHYDTGIIDHVDKTSGTVRSIFITLKSKAQVVIECYDYNKASEEKSNRFQDHLLIAIDSKEFAYWLAYKAYD